MLSCKTKQVNDTPPTSNAENGIKATGKVSHQYKSAGCETVIVCKKAQDTLLLIPMNPLEKFDKDGTEISFNYRILKVHNPKGCKGIPVQVSNIKEEKR